MNNKNEYILSDGNRDVFNHIISDTSAVHFFEKLYDRKKEKGNEYFDTVRLSIKTYCQNEKDLDGVYFCKTFNPIFPEPRYFNNKKSYLIFIINETKVYLFYPEDNESNIQKYSFLYNDLVNKYGYEKILSIEEDIKNGYTILNL